MEWPKNDRGKHCFIHAAIPRRSGGAHTARHRTGIAERVRHAGWDENEGAPAATHGSFATTKIKLAIKNVKNLPDLIMVVRPRVETRRSGEPEQRALFGAFAIEQVVDPASGAK
jgi:hypothetical protein